MTFAINKVFKNADEKKTEKVISNYFDSFDSDLLILQ